MLISQEEFKHNEDILKVHYGNAKYLNHLHNAIISLANDNVPLYYELLNFVINNKYDLMPWVTSNKITLDNEKSPENFLKNEITRLYNCFLEEYKLINTVKTIFIFTPNSDNTYIPQNIILHPLVINNEGTHLSTLDNHNDKQPYEFVNHPSHYNEWSYEVIDMIEKIYGTEQAAMWCEITAYKYAMRMGFKPTDSIQQEIDKRNWYLSKAKELKNKLNK